VGLDGLDGQVALVTGGGAGIGAAPLRKLAAAGADVAIVDRDAEAARAAAADVEAAGRRALPVALDLRELDAIPAVVDRVVAELGHVDVLVQCAYVHGWQARFSERLFEIRLEDWNLVYTVNVTAPLLLMQHVARHMIERGGGGRIVNVTSSSAFRADSPLAYGSSKAALTQLTRTAAAELGPHGITVNNVAPALTRTPAALSVFGDDTLNESVRSGSRANLLGRVAEPEDVAAAIVFLCLPEARHITAETIFATGGAAL
jgi:NAD(P)-dependent dehydrogenase (short-subunit alcohol dehydrogenase family)